MSKKSEEKDTATRAGDDADDEVMASAREEAEPVTEFAAESDAAGIVPPSDVANEKPAGKSSNPIAWLALLLSGAALAAVAYLVIEDWRDRATTNESIDSIARLGGRIDASADSLSDFDQRIAVLAAANADFAAQLNSQQRNIDERIRLLDSLPTRMSGLESTVASLQGVSAGTRDTWLLSEAENYMQIANAQLQLAGNPHLATLALRMADERIAQLGNPALIEVRTAVADELAALDIMEKPDIEGTTLTLSSLARVVDSLPLRGRENTEHENSDASDTEELSGIDRALASVQDAMSGLVKVTPPDQVATPLVTPDAVYFLRTNLTLQIQVARLALLRGETAVFEQSLDDASAWLQQYFDTDSTQVSASLQTIEEIRGGKISIAPPDISNSLRLLRQFRTLSETAQ
jgi:uroporphyrin-3 C-methyltransferase